MTEDACQNSCGHQAQLKEATRICKQVSSINHKTMFMFPCTTLTLGTQELDQGVCNGTEARWHFDEEARACVPFYFSGCAGNQNNFATRFGQQTDVIDSSFEQVGVSAYVSKCFPSGARDCVQNSEH